MAFPTGHVASSTRPKNQPHCSSARCAQCPRRAPATSGPTSSCQWYTRCHGSATDPYIGATNPDTGPSSKRQCNPTTISSTRHLAANACSASSECPAATAGRRFITSAAVDAEQGPAAGSYERCRPLFAFSKYSSTSASVFTERSHIPADDKR